MAQTVKMVTSVNGAVTEVGRCHPGQARVLQKNGMAEWKDGKLWLGAFTKPSAPSLQKIMGEDHVEVNVTTGLSDHLSMYANELMDEIDPGKEFQRPNFKSGSTKISFKDTRATKDIQVKTLKTWCDSLSQSKVLGHTLVPYDEPQRLRVGYIDENESEYRYVSVYALTQATDEDVSMLGMNAQVFKDLVKTEVGRHFIVLGQHPEEPSELEVSLEEAMAIWPSEESATRPRAYQLTPQGGDWLLIQTFNEKMKVKLPIIMVESQELEDDLPSIPRAALEKLGTEEGSRAYRKTGEGRSLVREPEQHIRETKDHTSK